ncbi:MAG: LexA family transcriptional regulator [Phycisphaerae bacterium]|nr:LexA family transcriptional regulator [Phycisphaerae bacterium]
MSLGKILRSKREEAGLTLDEIAIKTGFSKPYISTIETGRVKNPPSDDLLIKLEQVLGFEPGLLRHIAHLERMPSDIRRDFEQTDAQNRRMRQVIRNMMENKPVTEDLSSLLAEQSSLSNHSAYSITAGQMIPVVNKVSAGYPIDFDDMGYPVGIADEYVRCPDLHDPNAFAVRVIGDSMEPKFRQGDIVVFSPSIAVQNGDDCFVRFLHPHESTFKRVFFEKDNTIRLQPRNEMHPPLFVEANRINGIFRAVIRYEQL